jgi:hypothetical protein
MTSSSGPSTAALLTGGGLALGGVLVAAIGL